MTKSTFTKINAINNDLKIVKELVYDKCGFALTNLKLNPESVEYGACSFVLDGKNVQQRISKITPTKTGQFVTIWKRNEDGITQPFDVADNLDFIIIIAKCGAHFGQFVFPKSVLAEKGIISRNGIEGKRGIRVYPPWDIATNKQAEKTQSWQTKYFLTIKNDNATNIDLIRQLFSK